jgi:hypothetical protein
MAGLPMGQKLSQYRNQPLHLRRSRLLLSDPGRPDISVEITEPKGLLGRAKGLLGSTEVGRGRGMLIRAKQVHTLGMRYPIDTIYLDGQGHILRVETLRPGRLGPFLLSARWVLEMDEGEAARLGICPGGILVPKE